MNIQGAPNRDEMRTLMQTFSPLVDGDPVFLEIIRKEV
jgi:hypothetical protein